MGEHIGYVFRQRGKLIKDWVDPEKYIVVTYMLSTDQVEKSIPSLLDIAEQIAVESSLGTWIQTPYETEEYLDKYASFLLTSIPNGAEGEIRVAFPLCNVNLDKGGIPVLLSVIMGEIFGLRGVRGLRIVNIEFPEEIASYFKGPRFGMRGVKKMLNMREDERPCVAAIPVPVVGRTPEEYAEECYKAACGGADMIVDDRILASPKYCTLEERVAKVREKLDRAQSETNSKKLYATNITDRPDRLLTNADVAIKHGADILSVNMGSSMFSEIEILAEEGKKPIHAYSSISSLLTRGNYGLSMIFVTKLARLLGADQVYVGSAGGRLDVRSLSELRCCQEALVEPKYELKPSFPVLGGGLHAGNVGLHLKLLGFDIILGLGGGIWGLKTAVNGAKSVRQAIDIAMQWLDVEEIKSQPEKYGEFIEAVNLFGYTDVSSELMRFIRVPKPTTETKKTIPTFTETTLRIKTGNYLRKKGYDVTYDMGISGNSGITHCVPILATKEKECIFVFLHQEPPEVTIIDEKEEIVADISESKSKIDEIKSRRTIIWLVTPMAPERVKNYAQLRNIQIKHPEDLV